MGFKNLLKYSMTVFGKIFHGIFRVIHESNRLDLCTQGKSKLDIFFLNFSL